jgi:DNA-binding CsgD family transcriptional regulator
MSAANSDALRQSGQRAPDEPGNSLPSSILSADIREELRRALDLSPREFRIVLCLMDGFTRQATAGHLGCSPHTVDSHLRRIFWKLGVSNRASVLARLFVAFAEQEGLRRR